MQKLTKEQIEAARKEYEWYSGDITEGLVAAAPHLQYAPAPVDGDLVERMIATYASVTKEIVFTTGSMSTVAGMTAAARVLADALLGPVTDEEFVKLEKSYWKRTNDEEGEDGRKRILGEFVRSRRARIERKPTLGERIEEILGRAGMGDTRREYTAEIMAAIKEVL